MKKIISTILIFLSLSSMAISNQQEELDLRNITIIDVQADDQKENLKSLKLELRRPEIPSLVMSADISVDNKGAKLSAVLRASTSELNMSHANILTILDASKSVVEIIREGIDENGQKSEVMKVESVVNHDGTLEISMTGAFKSMDEAVGTLSIVLVFIVQRYGN